MTKPNAAGRESNGECAAYVQHQDDFSSVMVILCDFKLRKFQRRMLAGDEAVVGKMSQIEDALYRTKTRLNAALARSRIKSRVLSIDWLLPDSVRKNDKISCRMHVTCWVNFVKTRFSLSSTARVRRRALARHPWHCSRRTPRVRRRAAVVITVKAKKVTHCAPLW